MSWLVIKRKYILYQSEYLSYKNDFFKTIPLLPLSFNASHILYNFNEISFK